MRTSAVTHSRGPFFSRPKTVLSGLETMFMPGVEPVEAQGSYPKPYVGGVSGLSVKRSFT